MFELMEITFRHWLPNFYECWWDHIILDIILCNTGGILVAYYLMKRFGMREYKWSLRKSDHKSSFFENVKNLFLTPNLEHHEW
jgi:phosphatidylserine synthase 2